jgi:HlyD family secretion protein
VSLSSQIGVYQNTNQFPAITLVLCRNGLEYFLLSMASSKRSGSFYLILLVLAAAAGAGWYFFGRQEEKVVEYVTAPVTRADVTQAVTATGALQPLVTVEVGSQVSGIIDKVNVDYNSVVKQGDIVAHIDAATYESRLRAAQADVANADANKKLVELNANRTGTLQKNGLVPQSDLDQALAQQAQAEAQVQIRAAAVESAKIDLSRCTIYSPVDGIVLSRQIDVGKTVAASFNTPVLFTIANDLTKMRIIGSIAEADIGNVAIDQDVDFTVDAFPSRKFHGRVSLIRNSPITVQNVVTYETVIEVSNDDLKLRPGMTANVSVVVAKRTGALNVPNNALRVHLPDVALGSAPSAPAGALKPLPDDQRRPYLVKAGFVRGNGRPSDEILARARALAKADGFDWPDMSAKKTERAAALNLPVTRTLYRLVGVGAAAHPEAVSVKLGISDGTHTEVIEGLAEGDLVITTVLNPLKSPSSAPAASPFGGGPRRF